MASARARIFLGLSAAAWAVLLTVGLTQLWSYESTPGAAAHPPSNWPVSTQVRRAAGLPTFILFVHPRCPCSRATIVELSKLMNDCRGRLSARVLLLRPAGRAEGWEHTDLWDSAAAIPGVSVAADVLGNESRCFGVATSGEALLYSPDGQLLFAGGITESRGHQGDNAGRSALTLLLRGNAPSPGAVTTQVFGCPLFDEASAPLTRGLPACHTK